MGTFELERDRDNAAGAQVNEQRVDAAVDTRRIKQECIIAFKVYDQCRQPDCKIHQCVENSKI